MDIRILSDCRAEGRHLPAGEVASVLEETARLLILIGRAVAADPDTATEKEPKPAKQGGHKPKTTEV